MTLNYFKDILFDLLNESNELDVADIQVDDRENTFLVKFPDGTEVEMRCLLVQGCS